ncbi:MAG TPA: molybdopterin-dependent oxidoreductase [Candidatus Acidoferrales bacterium]|nr:molybdopterin-dependent oxidoreductase [Candidatus Acidoferrales bacterium]
MRPRFLPAIQTRFAGALGFASLLIACVLCCPQNLCAQATSSVALGIGGNVTTPLALSLADLKNMPNRQTLKVVNPHSKKTEVYQGVSLEDLLLKAGVPHGEALRGRAMASYVLAEAADNYRVVFSLAELDSSFTDSHVIVADTLDGAALGPNEGPLKLVAPRDKRPGRWIRMLKSLTVREAGN